LQDVWSDVAAWVQAIGTIAAVVGAAWVAAGETRAARAREEAARRDAADRESRRVEHARTAAVNLAVTAMAQVHELHALLRDETRRRRVTHVSPSLTLATTGRLLTAFPIESLEDASAMVAFAYFPGAMATAAEIYANLEAAVRAADDGGRAAVFGEYTIQMAQLEKAMQRRLKILKQLLAAPASEATPEPLVDAPAADQGGHERVAA
jgi:hypothetical protein